MEGWRVDATGWGPRAKERVPGASGGLSACAAPAGAAPHAEHCSPAGLQRLTAPALGRACAHVCTHVCIPVCVPVGLCVHTSGYARRLDSSLTGAVTNGVIDSNRMSPHLEGPTVKQGGCGLCSPQGSREHPSCSPQLLLFPALLAMVSCHSTLYHPWNMALPTGCPLSLRPLYCSVPADPSWRPGPTTWTSASGEAATSQLQRHTLSTHAKSMNPSTHRK